LSADVTTHAAPSAAVDAQVHVGKYVLLCAQLLLLAVLLRQFQIESNALLRVSLLAFAGFALHYFLPFALRLPFFVLLSIGGTVMILGLGDAVWLFGFGTVLIGICHLPLRYAYKVGALLTAGAGLALLRVRATEGPWSEALWPILGAMFMFRIMVYVYDLEHEKTPPSVWRTLAYFFPLPNVCFPLFPAIDYKGFRRGYYDIERHRIYQIGIDWMTRGVVQLILYRVFYYDLALPPAEVIDPDTLTRFLVANFLLYLKISGTFHLIAGMLHLFGFNLPETHHRYCLASSFTDFWRRINIYWKDFMLKLFYLPLYFRLRGYGDTVAVVLSTAAVFLCSWLLHSYQWFWLRGDFPIEWQDGVFWMTLAALVVFGSLREMKHGRRRKLAKGDFDLREAAGRGLRTVLTFFSICILWSLWGCESWASWLSLWDFLWDGVPRNGSAVPLLTLAVAAVVFIAGVWLGDDSRGEGSAAGEAGRWQSRSTMATALTLLALTPLSIPAVYLRLGTETANAILSLRSGHLSRADAAMHEKGYYEDLTRVNRFNSELWKIYRDKRVLHWLDVREGAAGLVRYTGDFQFSELTPSFKADTPYGAIEINQWGMRDRYYDKTPAPGVHRIAVLGSSLVMGWGVRREETLAAVLEAELNRSAAPQDTARYEVLNFGVPGYQPPQNLKALDDALAFGPQTVVYIATGRELARSVDFLAQTVSNGITPPYAPLAEIAVRAGASARPGHTTAVKRLLPHDREIIDYVYRQLAEATKAAGATPVWVFVPQPMENRSANQLDAAMASARAAGFVVINLVDVFDDVPGDSVSLELWDRHPNAIGHRMIGEAIFEALTADGGVLHAPGP
jgi:hypothetical protein